MGSDTIRIKLDGKRFTAKSCPVNGCNMQFPFSPQNYRSEIVHLLAHFHQVFPDAREHGDGKQRIGGISMCPYTGCNMRFCAETIGWIMEHRIQHVRDNPEMFQKLVNKP